MTSIREKFLNQNQNKRIKVILNNGFQLSGILREFDNEDILFDTDAYGSGPVLISKRAISTMVPAKK